jgi:heat shock protein HslJ
LGLFTTVNSGNGMAAEDFAEMGGKWTLAEIGGRKVPSGREAPSFAIDGTKVSGFDGCNRFSGDLLKPGMIAATRRGCKDDTLKLPLDLNRLYDHLKEGKLVNGSLVFAARRGFPASRFVR